MYKADLVSYLKVRLIIVFKWVYFCKSRLIIIVCIFHLVTQQHELSSLV